MGKNGWRWSLKYHDSFDMYKQYTETHTNAYNCNNVELVELVGKVSCNSMIARALDHDFENALLTSGISLVMQKAFMSWKNRYMPHDISLH